MLVAGSRAVEVLIEGSRGVEMLVARFAELKTELKTKVGRGVVVLASWIPGSNKRDCAVRTGNRAPAQDICTVASPGPLATCAGC